MISTVNVRWRQMASLYEYEIVTVNRKIYSRPFAAQDQNWEPWAWIPLPRNWVFIGRSL